MSEKERDRERERERHTEKGERKREGWLSDKGFLKAAPERRA